MRIRATINYGHVRPNGLGNWIKTTTHSETFETEWPPMTTTPEERAREVTAELSLACFADVFPFDPCECRNIIAAALRATENEALERAARTLEDEKAKIEPPRSYAMTNFCMGLQHGATAIRALKTGE